MKKPKLLVLDIETAPAVAFVWNLFDDTVPLERLIRPSRILCWGAKWVGKTKFYHADERGGRREMLERLHALISEADAVITYNGDKFDLPKINGELLIEGLPPVPPVASIDLIKTVRRLGLMSSRLEFFAIEAKIGRKIKHAGFSLWRGCMDGDEKSWKRMLWYNRGDVKLTERGYVKLLPFIKTHPALFPKSKNLTFGCPYCGGRHVQSRGYRYTQKFRIERFQCLSCHKWPDGKREKVKA